jgi:hypothetical protein
MTHIPAKKYFIISSRPVCFFSRYHDPSLSVLVSGVNLPSDAMAAMGFTIGVK